VCGVLHVAEPKRQDVVFQFVFKGGHGV
jgi:hypothetical protein